MSIPGNDLQLGTIINGDEPLVLNRRDRARHFYAVGATRTGKSKLIENMARGDLQQWGNFRCPVVVLDPHGTLFDGVMNYVAAEGLKRWPIVPVDLRSTGTIVSYNALRKRAGTDLSVACKGFTDAILHAWNQSSTNETPRLATWLFAILAYAVEKDTTLIEAMQVLADPAVRRDQTQAIEHFVARTTFESASRLHEREFLERVESTTHRLNRFISTQLVRAMICQTGETLDMGQVLEKGQIVVANLGVEGSKVAEEDSRVLGSVLLSDLWQAARRRGKREEGKLRPCYVYLDEFQRFLGPTIAEGLSEASGHGLHLSLAHQTPSQLTDLGDTGKMVLNSVLTNAKTKVVFQLSHPEDLELLTSILYRQTVDTDEVKFDLYTTKTLAHQLTYLPSYTVGSSVGSESGTQESVTEGESETVGTNWNHTDTTSESVTETDSWSEGVSVADAVSHGVNHSNTDSASESYGRSHGRSQSTGRSHGGNRTESSSHTDASSKVWGTAASRAKSGTTGDGKNHSESMTMRPESHRDNDQLLRYRFTKASPADRAIMKSKHGVIASMDRNELARFEKEAIDSYSFSNGGSHNQSTSWSVGDSRSEGGTRSVSDGRSISSGASWSENQSHGTSDMESVNQGRSHGRSIGENVSHSQTAGANWNHTTGIAVTQGVSSADSYGGSEAHTTSRSRSHGSSQSTSHSQSQSTGYAPMLMPIMGKELAGRQFRSVEEQLYRASQILDGLPDRHCVVRLASQKHPVLIYTKTVRKPLSTPKLTASATQALLRKLPFVMSMEEALARVAARELSSRNLNRKVEEPTRASRKLAKPTLPDYRSGESHG